MSSPKNSIMLLRGGLENVGVGGIVACAGGNTVWLGKPGGCGPGYAEPPGGDGEGFVGQAPAHPDVASRVPGLMWWSKGALLRTHSPLAFAAPWKVNPAQLCSARSMQHSARETLVSCGCGADVQKAPLWTPTPRKSTVQLFTPPPGAAAAGLVVHRASSKAAGITAAAWFRQGASMADAVRCREIEV